MEYYYLLEDHCLRGPLTLRELQQRPLWPCSLVWQADEAEAHFAVDLPQVAALLPCEATTLY